MSRFISVTVEPERACQYGQWLDEAGRQIRRDGKGQYVANIRWRSCDLTDRFSAALVELVRAVHPDAFDAGPR
jgi:hypothetical protein